MNVQDIWEVNHTFIRTHSYVHAKPDEQRRLTKPKYIEPDYDSDSDDYMIFQFDK